MRISWLIFVATMLVASRIDAQVPAQSGQSPAHSAAATKSPDDPLTPCHWRVVWLSNPSTEAILAWDTHEPGKRHRVTIREHGSDDRQVVLANTEEYAFLKPEDLPFFHHHVAVSDLMPGKRYDVQFDSDDRTSRWFYFETARSDDQPFSLMFGGDSRTGLEKRRQMNQMIANVVTESWNSNDEGNRVYALVHGGDYVFTGTNPSMWHEWLAAHELTAGDDGRLLPVIPARGNHDRGRLFSQVFGFEPSDQNYYGISFGPMLRMVTLNTEASIAGDQATWLEGELTSSRPVHRWLVAQYHRPAYPAVKSPSGALAHWVPLFEKHNVDLVCEADGHNIKRTLPIRAGTYDPTGVVYIGEGGMGVPQRTPKTNRWFLRPPGFAGRGHHVQLLKFTQEELQIKCRLLNGKSCDNSTIHSRQ